MTEQKNRTEKELNYYILFENYTHGLALEKILKEEGIPARIAPTPRSIQGELSCGMSLLVREKDIDDVRECLDAGMNGHVAKPFDPEKLVELLASCI